MRACVRRQSRPESWEGFRLGQEDDEGEEDEDEEQGSTRRSPSAAETLSSSSSSSSDDDDDLSEWSADGTGPESAEEAEEGSDERPSAAPAAERTLPVAPTAPAHGGSGGTLAALGPFQLPPLSIVPRATGAAPNGGGACPTVQALTRMAAEHARARMLAHAPGQVLYASGTPPPPPPRVAILARALARACVRACVRACGMPSRR